MKHYGWQNRNKGWLIACTGLVAIVLVGPTGLSLELADDAKSPDLSASSHSSRDWHFDSSDTGIDDRLEAPLRLGERGDVVVELKYDRSPTEHDVELLLSQFRVQHAYRYNNWDEILVRIGHEDVPGLLDAPGVVAVEWIPPATLDLDVSTSAIRAAETDVIADGFNHSLAVHETYGLKGEGMVIAILDMGVDTNHVSLQGSLVSKLDPVGGGLLLGGADINNSLAVVGCVDPVDHTGHGTHVAGTALGRGGGETFPGVAPAARLVDIGISSSLAAGLDGISIGLDWLMDFNAGETCYGDPGDDKVDVLSVSLSLPSNDPEESLNRKFTDVVRSGITVIFSAGNSGASLGAITKGVEGAILVANGDDQNTVPRGDDLLDCRSSRGPRPSESVGPADLMPHVAAPGSSILAPNANTLTGADSKTGTSMAAPHVAGLAALILQADPSLRPVHHEDWRLMGDPGAVPVRDVLVRSAEYRDEVPSNCPSPQMAMLGMFDRPWNNAWGYGLADGFEAIRVALGGEPLPSPELPDPSEPGEPYQQNFTWEGHLNCSLRTGPAGLNVCVPVFDDDFVHRFILESGAKSVVAALVWEPGAVNLLDDLWIFFERVTNAEYDRGSGQSPVEVRADDPYPGHAQFRVFAGGDANLVIDQPFTVHYHVFYHEYAPQGYSAVP